MRFVDLLNTNIEQENIEETFVEQKPSITESSEKPEELLRKAGFKIKLVTKTSFGIQISFAKKYNKEEIVNLLSNFKLKFKDETDVVEEIFIIE